MSQGWDKVRPAPTEKLHSLIMEEFHEYRRSIDPENTNVELNGIDLGNIIARAKTKLYEEYPEARKNVPK